MLSDSRILEFMASGDITFTDEFRNPLVLDGSQFQPMSVDLTLGAIDAPRCECPRDPGVHWTLQPRQFVLASTLEAVGLSDRVGALVVGKSSVARYGIQVEAAGLVDPGFWGQLTLEVVNFADTPITLTYGERVCQITFDLVDGPVIRPYGSKGLKSRYQGQMGPTHAKEDPQS